VNTELATPRVVQQPKGRARKNRFIKMVRRASQSAYGAMNQIRDDVTPNAPPGRADNDACQSGEEESPPDKAPSGSSHFLMAALRLWEIKNRMRE
jgi:hypothetical protein